MRRQLTAQMIDKLTPPSTGRLEIFDAIVPGLALRVTSTGAKSFVVRGRVKGRGSPIRVTLGDPRNLKLAAARQAASDALRAMNAGTDPRPAKTAAAAVKPAATVRQLIEDWRKLHLVRRRPGYAKEAVRAIQAGLSPLLDRAASGIVKSDVVNLLDEIGSPSAAEHLRKYGHACFGWAQKRDQISVNPFAGLPDAPPSAQRERVLDDGEVAAIWNAAGKIGYPFGPYFKLLLLTLQRRQEVAQMRWSELDDPTVWAIPGARMKKGKPQRVHLSEAARAVLLAVPRLVDCDFVFSSGRRGAVPISGFSQGKFYLDAAVAEAQAGRPLAPWVPHDFRRTGVSKLAELGFDSIVADKLLAHQPAKLAGVAAIYQRYDFARERAAALDAWANHVTSAAGAVR